MKSGLLWLTCFAMGVSEVRAQGVIEFVQEGCVPCARMAPTMARLERAGIRVVRIDANKQSDVAKSLGITTTPTFVAVSKSGFYVDRIVGETKEKTLRALYQRAQQAN